MDQLDAQALAVKVTVKVEQMYLQKHFVTSETRPYSDIGHSRVLGSVSGGSHGVNTTSRMDVFGKPDVRRGKTDRPPATISFDNGPLDLERPSEHLFDGKKVASRQSLSHAGRRIGLAVRIADFMHARVVEPEIITQFEKCLRAALPTATKREVMSGHDKPGVEAAHQDTRHELPRTQRCEKAIERNDNQRIDPQRLDEVYFGATRRYAERLSVRLEDLTGMWLEREHQPRNGRGPRDSSRLSDHGPMSEVHAVEVANSDGAAAGLGRKIREMAEHAHAA